MTDENTLASLLLEYLDPDFPVSTGNGKADDPLVVTATHDYVSVEHAAVRHVMTMVREDYRLAEQRVHHNGDRVIDELVVDVKPSGANEWTGRRRFFFDITAGFGIK
ncbi:MAG TPA: hypothetical protein PKH75_15155 [Bacillota bacterium]|nr:hypothetical protein [Bacillota bacterium]